MNRNYDKTCKKSMGLAPKWYYVSEYARYLKKHSNKIARQKMKKEVSRHELG